MTAESSGPPYEFHGERAGNARHAARARVGIARPRAAKPAERKLRAFKPGKRARTAEQKAEGECEDCGKAKGFTELATPFPHELART